MKKKLPKKSQMSVSVLPDDHIRIQGHGPMTPGRDVAVNAVGELAAKGVDKLIFGDDGQQNRRLPNVDFETESPDVSFQMDL